MLSKPRLYAMLGLSAIFAYGPVHSQEVKAVEANKSEEVDIKTLSQAFGNFIGKNLKQSGLNFDLDSLITGLKDGSLGKPSPLSDKEYEKAMLALQEKTVKRLSEENLNKANQFIKENETKPNVVVLEPGKLQYLILEQGTGPAVAEHGTPSIQYKGSYIDGTVFGNSHDSGGPISLPLDQTIQGFAKGIVGMKEGEKRRIFVHPELGYGTSGQLPPNSLLIFDVEVIKAQSEDKTASMNDKKASASQKSFDSAQDSDDDDDDLDDDEDDDDDDDDLKRTNDTNTYR